MKYKIECEIPDGYEPTGEVDLGYLWPMKGKPHLDARIMLRKLPPAVPDPREWWPKWLLAPWVAQSKLGSWFSFLKKPHCDNGWSAEGRRWIDTDVFDIPFPDVPWEKSCFRNPWLEEEHGESTDNTRAG